MALTGFFRECDVEVIEKKMAGYQWTFGIALQLRLQAAVVTPLRRTPFLSPASLQYQLNHQYAHVQHCSDISDDRIHLLCCKLSTSPHCAYGSAPWALALGS